MKFGCQWWITVIIVSLLHTLGARSTPETGEHLVRLCLPGTHMSCLSRQLCLSINMRPEDGPFNTLTQAHVVIRAI